MAGFWLEVVEAGGNVFVLLPALPCSCHAHGDRVDTKQNLDPDTRQYAQCVYVFLDVKHAGQRGCALNQTSCNIQNAVVLIAFEFDEPGLCTDTGDGLCLRHRIQNFSWPCTICLLLLNQLYKPGWVLACSTIFFQASLSSILVLQFVIFIARRSASTSSFHLVLGLPRYLLSKGFHFIIALTFLLSSILFTLPYHANLWDFINRTIFFSLISASISWFVLTLLSLFLSWTGPYILPNIFL